MKKTDIGLEKFPEDFYAIPGTMFIEPKPDATHLYKQREFTCQPSTSINSYPKRNLKLYLKEHHELTSCNDCLHSDICYECEGGFKNCSFFKDKSLFIELPCPLGTKVYRIVSNGLADWPDPIKYKVIWDSFRLIDIYEIGKTIFLTREEAEEALEQKNN